MNYKPRLNSTNTPNRKTRKGSRFEIFMFNRTAKKKLKKARRAE